MSVKKEWKIGFASRFRRREDELKRLYCGLYHNDMKAWEAFIDGLYRRWEERPEPLKGMDRAREENPDWYRGHGLVGMQMYADAFAGNLKGVRKKAGLHRGMRRELPVPDAPAGEPRRPQ